MPPSPNAMADLAPRNVTDTQHSGDEKPTLETLETLELVQTATSKGHYLPTPAKARGLLLDAEGLTSRGSLQLASDGHTVLLPQPTGDPNDPLNWSWTRKHLILFTIGWAALCADFTSAAGNAGIFPQAAQWGITPDRANQPNSINVLMGGIGGLIWVPMSSYWGRAPVLFWSTVCGFAVSIGAVVSPTYECYYAMRVLTALFLTSGQTMTVAFLKDLFFHHERAQKIGLWAMLYIASPYLGPCLGNFVIYKTGRWPDIFWLCAGVVALDLVFIVAFIDETWYDRHIHHDQPARPGGPWGRLMRLTGIWQLQHHKTYFPSILVACKRFGLIITKPAFFLICLSYFLVFAWAIGINISTTILFAQPQVVGGYGYTNLGLGFLYFTPIVAVFVGETFGHFFNDYIANRYIHRHKGVFEPEVRLWMIHVSMVFMIPALVLVGQALEKHLNVAAVIFGWGMFVFGVMGLSVATTAYALDSYPTAPAEIGGWINFARTFGGFSVGYFQMPWEQSVGAAGSFGTQAAIVAVAGVLVIIIHIYGHLLRHGAGDID